MFTKKDMWVINSTFFIATFLNAVGFTQFLTFMIQSGFTSVERGWILSMAAILGLVAQYFTGYLVDHFKSTRGFMIVIQCLSVFTLFLTFSQQSMNPFILFPLTLVLMSLAKELMETWIFNLNGPYSIFRSMASIGWSVGSMLLAMLIKPLGYPIITKLAIVSLIVLIPLLSMMKEPLYHHVEKKLELKDVFTLFKNKKYNYLLLSYFFILLLMNIDSIAIVEYMLSLKIPQSAVGMKYGLTALTEVPFFLLTGVIFKKFSDLKVLKFCILLLACRFFAYAISSTEFHFLAIAFISGGIYPFINVLQHELSLKYSPDHLMSSSQMVMSALIINLPSIISPTILGYLSQVLNTQTIILVCGFLYILPFITVSLLDKA